MRGDVLIYISEIPSGVCTIVFLALLLLEEF